MATEKNQDSHSDLKSDLPVVITGASQGIGLALAERFIFEGYRVVGIARRWPDLQVNDLFDGNKNLRLTLNLRGEGSRLDLYRTVSRWYRAPLCLINNAVYVSLGKIDAIPLREVKDMIDLNCVAPLHLIGLFGAEMQSAAKGQFPCVINISSLGDRDPLGGMVAYGATKGFLSTLTQGCVKEYDDLKFFNVRLGSTMTTGFGSLFPNANTEFCMTAEYVAEKIFTVFNTRKSLNSGDIFTYHHPEQEKAMRK